MLAVRVVKTTKQTHQEHITYPQALKEIIAKDGVVGLFGRGLQTRIITNGLQVWRSMGFFWYSICVSCESTRWPKLWPEGANSANWHCGALDTTFICAGDMSLKLRKRLLSERKRWSIGSMRTRASNCAGTPASRCALVSSYTHASLVNHECHQSCVQGLLFAVAWKYFEKTFFGGK